MTDEAEYTVVFSTVPSIEVAEEIARDLVGNHLAACVNLVGGIMSIYEWDGEIKKDKEVLLIIKTRQEHVKKLTERILEIHPYDIPEVIALPIVSGSRAYLDWIDSVIGPMKNWEDEQ